MVEMTEKSRGLRKRRKGVVVRKSGDKSVVVEVGRRTRHPLYGKVLRSSKNYHAHDEENKAQVGDAVEIIESRPISRLKRWRVVSIQQPSEAKAGETIS